MKERGLIISIIIIAAILIGVMVVVQQVHSPIMRRLVSQQAEILENQKELFTQLKELDRTKKETVAQDVKSAGLASDKIDERLSSIDQKVSDLIFVFKKLSANAAMGATGEQKPSDEYTKVHKIDFSHTPLKGNKAAPVTIVAFTDFQCPYSARFQPVIDQVLDAYPENVNFALKHFPLNFHPQGRPAAKAVLAAGEQGKFYEMSSLVLKDGSNLNYQKYEEFAQQLGLNLEQFRADYEKKNAEWEKIIQADYSEGQRIGVRGTPTYYINGRKTRARNLAAFKNEINKIINKKAQ